MLERCVLKIGVQREESGAKIANLGCVSACSLNGLPATLDVGIYQVKTMMQHERDVDVGYRESLARHG
jgi:hypothetical protein